MTRAAAILLVLVFSQAGCASVTIEEALPEGALPSGPVDSGTYPDLNIRPSAAAPQLSDAERRAAETELEAARQALQQQANQTRMETDTAELERLRRSHAREALKAIEGE
jgi:hypothetical protein